MTDDRIERLELDIDLRCRDIWQFLYDLELDEELLEAVAMIVRASYAQGYHDHATEPVENQLYRDHGYSMPRRLRVG